jgi:hypothetical protein
MVIISACPFSFPSPSPLSFSLILLLTPSHTDGNSGFQWRHWGCTTTKQFENMKASFDEAEELDGYEDLQPEDQERVKKAFEEGHGALLSSFLLLSSLFRRLRPAFFPRY